MKFKYIEVYENNSDNFDTEHYWIRVKVTAAVQFSHLPQYKLLGPTSIT